MLAACAKRIHPRRVVVAAAVAVIVVVYIYRSSMRRVLPRVITILVVAIPVLPWSSSSHTEVSLHPWSREVHAVVAWANPD